MHDSLDRVAYFGLTKMTFYNQLSSPNTAIFDNFSKPSLEQAKRRNRKLGLIVFDIGGLETINSRYGHETGDRLLNTMAERLRSYIRSKDMLTYLGEGLFFVILIDPEHSAAAVLEAEYIKQKMAVPLSLKSGQDLTVEISAEIAVYPENVAGFDRLLAATQKTVLDRATCRQCIASDGKGGLHDYVNILPMVDLSTTHCIGIPVIDEQHKQLGILINGLYEAIKNTTRNNRQHAAELYDKLIAFTELHFNTELRLMTEAAYPQTDVHNRAHQFLLNELRFLKNRIIEGSELNALFFLMDWLIGHIDNDDKPLGTFLLADKKTL
jgi:hemerythrin-like metal-binding protein/diguanylate cyclase (GGDEF)-like protein